MTELSGDRSQSSVGGTRIEAKDLRCKQRQPLQEVIPLPAPFVVYIDPTNRCNFKCQFCPTGAPDLLRQVGRPSAFMRMDLFDKVAGDLAEFGVPLKLASLYKDGEPLLNKHFPAMVRRMKAARLAERVWTKTNGSRLSPALNEELVDAGLDLICISIESVSRSGYKRIAGVDIDYERFVQNVADLYSRRGQMEIYIKIADSGLSVEERDKFYEDFQPYCTQIAVEKLMGWSYSGVKDFTLGTKPDTYDGLPFVQKEVCAYPFYVLAINADGSVSLCGNDWSHGTVVGNVADESLLSIWRGDRLLEFRRKMLDGRRCEIPACADCYYLQIVPDNLDPYREKILRNLEFGA